MIKPGWVQDTFNHRQPKKYETPLHNWPVITCLAQRTNHYIAKMFYWQQVKCVRSKRSVGLPVTDRRIFKIDPVKQYFFLGPSKIICKQVVLCHDWQKVVICSDNLQGNIPVRKLDLVQQRPKELVQYDILPKNSNWYVYLQKNDLI